MSPKREKKKKKQRKVEISIEPFPGADPVYCYDATKTYTYFNYIISIGDDRSIFCTFGYNYQSIADWLVDIQHIYRRHRYYLLVCVSLDSQLNKKGGASAGHPYTVLTLCIGSHCLNIFLGWDDKLPKPFRDFLNNPDVFFVGVDMEKKKRKLEADRGVVLRKVVDLLPVAEESLGKKILQRGLQNVAGAVLGEEYEVEKPERVKMGDYEDRDMLPEQVKYSCFEAFLAFEIGKKLLT